MTSQEKQLKFSGYLVFIIVTVFIMFITTKGSVSYESEPYEDEYEEYGFGEFDSDVVVPADSSKRGFSDEAKGAAASIFNPRNNATLKGIFSDYGFTVTSNLSFMWWEFDRDPWEFEFIITEHEVQEEYLQKNHGIYSNVGLGASPVVFLVRDDILNVLELNRIVTTEDEHSYFVDVNKLLEAANNSEAFTIKSPSPAYSGTGLAFAQTVVAAKAGTVEFTKEDVASNSIIVAETIKDSVVSGLLEADVFKGVIAGDISVGVLPENYIIEQALAGSLGDYGELTILYPKLPVWLEYNLFIMSTDAKTDDKNRVWELDRGLEKISWDQLGIRQAGSPDIVSPIKRQLGVMKTLPTKVTWNKWGVNDYLLQILKEVRG